MKNILTAALFILAISMPAYANDSWKDVEEYKLISMAGAFECPLKVTYVLYGSGKLSEVKVTPKDYSLCELFNISTSSSSFTRNLYDATTNSVEQDITISWTNPGSDVKVSSTIKVTIYEELSSKKCIFGSSKITNRGTYSCLWGVLDCSVPEYHGLSNEYLTRL